MKFLGLICIILTGLTRGSILTQSQFDRRLLDDIESPQVTSKSPGFFTSIKDKVSDGFSKLADNVSKGVDTLKDKIQNKVDSFTKDIDKNLDQPEIPKAVRIEDQIDSFINQKSLANTKSAQKEIDDLFTDAGSLNDSALNTLISESTTGKLERDYHMSNSRISISNIQSALSPIINMENKFKEFEKPELKNERTLFSSDFHGEIYKTVNALFAKRTNFREEMSVISVNLDYMRRSDFDIAAFYFGDLYKNEEKFIFDRSNTQIDQLANIYIGQKDVFANSVSNLRVIYDDLNRILGDLFGLLDEIYLSYLERTKKAELAKSFSQKDKNRLTDLFILRREFAEKMLIYTSVLERIETQKVLLEKVFVYSVRINELYDQSQEAEKLINRSLQSQTRNPKLMNLELKNIVEENQDEIDTLINDLSSNISDMNNSSLDSKDLKVRIAARDQDLAVSAANLEKRKKQVEIIDSRIKLAKKKGTLNSLKEDNESTKNTAESFFSQRDQENKSKSLIQNLKTKIFQKEIKMADINDKETSDVIVQQILQESGVPTNNIEESSKSSLTQPITSNLGDRSLNKAATYCSFLFLFAVSLLMV